VKICKRYANGLRAALGHFHFVTDCKKLFGARTATVLNGHHHHHHHELA